MFLIRCVWTCLPETILVILETGEDKASVVSKPRVLSLVILIVNMQIWYCSIFFFNIRKPKAGTANNLPKLS